jgi:hypothetical protein
MGTGYSITLGYQSGYSTCLDQDEAWQALVDCVQALRLQPERIVKEAQRLGAPAACEDHCCTLQQMAEAYSSNDDATLRINQRERYIYQLATGDRTLKEHVRRAFCRLVIEEMHRQGIEVCLEVA